MCCPHFLPAQPKAQALSAQTAMLPLGDLWTGSCHAVPAEAWEPDQHALECCNLGYARSTCPRFPAADGPDAVRFAIEGDDGAVLRIRYVLEQDHHPFAHGAIGFSIAEGRFPNLPFGATFRRQAEAYATSYVRRRDAALE